MPKLNRRALLKGLGASAFLFSPLFRTLRAESQNSVPSSVLFFFTPVQGVSFSTRLSSIPTLDRARWGTQCSWLYDYGQGRNQSVILNIDDAYNSVTDKQMEVQLLYGRPRALPNNDFELPWVLSPLQANKSNILYVGGLLGHPYPHQNPDYLEVGDPFRAYSHASGTMTFLTGSRIVQNAAAACSGAAGSHTPTNVSFDTFLAEQMGVPLLHLGYEFSDESSPCGMNHYISFSRGSNGTFLPNKPKINPRATFLELFGNLLQCSGDTNMNTGLTADDWAALDKSVLDYVSDDLNKLKAQSSPREYAIVDDHLQAIRELEKSLFSGPTLIVSDQCPPPQSKCTEYLDSNTINQELSPAKLQQMLDIAAISMACGLRPVVSIVCEDGLHGGRVHKNTAGVTEETHTMSHGDKDEFIKTTYFYGTMFNELIERMKAFKFDTQTALDRSLLVWGSQLGDGGDHRHSDVPYVLAGGLNGKFKTGQFVDFGRGNTTVKKGAILTTIKSALNYGNETFGDTNFSGPPLTQLLR